MTETSFAWWSSGMSRSTSLSAASSGVSPRASFVSTSIFGTASSPFTAAT